jgi:hypothetical protein
MSHVIGRSVWGPDARTAWFIDSDIDDHRWNFQIINARSRLEAMYDPQLFSSWISIHYESLLDPEDLKAEVLESCMKFVIDREVQLILITSPAFEPASNLTFLHYCVVLLVFIYFLKKLYSQFQNVQHLL